MLKDSQENIGDSNDMLSSSTLAKLSKKELLPLLLILFIAILFDITSRFNGGEANNGSIWKSENGIVSNTISLNQSNADALLNLLNRYETSEELTNKKNGMSEADQLAQQGDLNELFSKDMRYRLMGIFNHNDRFAVISKQNTENNKQELIRVRVKDNLEDYQVADILADRIIISHGIKEANLFLYKTNN